MQTSKLLNDEFSSGYRGRLRALNPKYRTVEKFMVALRKAVRPVGTLSAKPSAAETLAAAAGVSIEYFVQRHSLFPLYQAVSDKGEPFNSGDESDAETMGYFGTRNWRRSIALFCPECIEEDTNTLGFSYWRRSHQLPGMSSCGKHRCQLANHPKGTKAFDSMPQVGMAGQFQFSEQEFSQVLENPVIQRYAEIALAFLDAERPMRKLHARFRIAERVKKLNLRVSKLGNRPTLTDKILEQVPEFWLRTVYSTIEKREAGKYFYPIDNITLERAEDQSYALALAALFDSSQEALAYWYGDTEGLPEETRTQRSFGRDHWSSAAMLKTYIEHSGNYRSMSASLSVSPTYLRTVLNAAGLPGLGLLDMATTGKAIVDFQSGMALEAACVANGASQEEVERLLRVAIFKFSEALAEISRKENKKD